MILALASCVEGHADPVCPAGPGGNANVVSSTVEVGSNDWVYDANGSCWVLDLSWNEIDVDMVDYGAVLVYFENPNPSVLAWHQLPLTLYPSSLYSSTMETSYYDYGLSVFWTNSDLQQHENPCYLYGSNLTFKIVLIDATVYMDYQDTDFSNYETVKQLFNLQD